MKCLFLNETGMDLRNGGIEISSLITPVDQNLEVKGLVIMVAMD